MVDSRDINKYLNINIGIVMKKPEMLKLVPDHLKTEKMCRHAVKNYLSSFSKINLSRYLI